MSACYRQWQALNPKEAFKAVRLLDLSTVTDAKTSSQPWVKFQSAGWVSFQSAPTRVFELAEKLISAKLPHKALSITTRLIPDHALWPSKFVLIHLHCLLETEQYRTFDDVFSRVEGADASLTLMSFRSLKAERMGEHQSAIDICDQMIAESPDSPYGWYRGCFLRDRYRSKAEQQEFQSRVPDELLKEYSPNVIAILYFLTLAGNFQRAESRWVEFFLEDPRARAVELINFHFGLSIGGRKQCDFEVSAELGQCRDAFQFEQDSSTMIRLIVDDHQGSNEFTLKESSPLAELLQSLPVGRSGTLGMLSYKVVERLPPYVACLRIALQLRHTHNDGSDSFAMLTMPSDTDQLVPFLEKKLSLGLGSKNLPSSNDNVPLYIRGHFLYRDNALKSALNCWRDLGIPKSLLFNQGSEAPGAVVLDAYGIGYLAVTDLAQRMLDIGFSFVLSAATKEALRLWVEEISDEKFMLLGVSDGGKLFRTTASDIQIHDGHTLRALRLILVSSIVAHPVLHDSPLEVYSIKDGIDSTVYEAMQLSSANCIPWFCMDETFASLHLSTKHPAANVHAILAQAMASGPFDFEHKRHGFLLHALGALRLPLTFGEILDLAGTRNTLAEFILFKIIQNHGHQMFVSGDRPLFLLEVIFTHLNSRYLAGHSQAAIRPSYAPWATYTKHVFNHGMNLFLEIYGEGTAEHRLALAIARVGGACERQRSLIQFVTAYFVDFAEGHFMDIEAVQAHLNLLVDFQPGDPR